MTLNKLAKFQTQRKNHSTTAIYSDTLRKLIIDEVEKRPVIWDTKSREPNNILLKRQNFAEIAGVLSNEEVSLRATDIEKQWKNMKVMIDLLKMDI